MSRITLAGVDTYYTEAGEGPPLVLLHGGMSDSSAWGPLVDMLATRFHVFAPDRRGHGRTPDTTAPFSYADMAAETIAFCQAVIGAPAHLVGWSDGGITSLQVSLSHPAVVARQVLIGTNFDHSALLLDQIGLGEGPDDDDAAMLRAMYEDVSVMGPEYWPVFWSKTRTLWATEPNMTSGVLSRVGTPTLVMAGDDEPIPLAHTVELYESISQAQLCVIPGASHIVPLEQPGIVEAAIRRFLTMDLPPATLEPVRRA